jgi:hypothetical protein
MTDPNQDGVVVDEQPAGATTAPSRHRLTIYIGRYPERLTASRVGGSLLRGRRQAQTSRFLLRGRMRSLEVLTYVWQHGRRCYQHGPYDSPDSPLDETRYVRLTEIEGEGGDVETISLARHRRAARNQGLFEEVNELIEKGSVRLLSAASIAFVCECNRADCTELLPLTLSEYESVRAVPSHFLVKPSHADEALERVVVGAGDRYEVVQLVEDSGRTSTKLGP